MLDYALLLSINLEKKYKKIIIFSENILEAYNYAVR